MNGMNTHTGKLSNGIEHLRQSITDILTTPLHTRVMVPDYGSKLPRLIDSPSNKTTLIEIYAAVAIALKKWEPRYRLNRVLVASTSPGKIMIDLDGIYLVNNKPLQLEGLILS